MSEARGASGGSGASGVWTWLLLACALAHLGLAAWARAEAAPETYVLTPYVEVVPGAAPLGATDAAALAAELRGPIDARDIQRGYAWMGSTLSLTDLVDGINGLEAAGLPLSGGQRAELAEQLGELRADHAAMVAVQTEILDRERALDHAMDAARRALGAEAPPVGPGAPR